MTPQSTPPSAAATPAASERASAALIAANSWSLWCSISRGLAHHLANAAQMLAIDPPPRGARNEAVERIGIAQARLGELHRTGTPGPTLVPDALEDLQALQRLQSGFPSVELEIESAAGLPAVGITSDNLRHVLLALVTNAKQAAAGERARIRIEVRADTEGVEILIEDDGPGLSVEIAEQAFAPFFTTRGNGALGLGLAVARDLARDAGGSLDAEAGTSRFRLHLPAWLRPQRERAASSDGG